MSTINSKKFGQICDGVWRDRIAIQKGRGILSCETALIRAVYWRLCKEGVVPNQRVEDYHVGNMLHVYQRLIGLMLKQNANPSFDGTLRMKELIMLSISESHREHQATYTVGAVSSM